MEPKFRVQWHLTNKCTNNCKFCYITQRKLRELSTKEIFSIIDSLEESARKLGLKPMRIYFTGGDPLLRKDLFEILSYCREKDIDIGILGCPNLLTSQIIKKLSKYISRYQISIDGLENTHDYFRGKGSFRLSISALKKLKKAGILTIVQSTVSKVNMEEMPSLAKYIASKKIADIYSFARLVPEGAGKQFKEDLPSPSEYRDFLLKMFYTYQEIRKYNKEIMFHFKEPLWNLLFYELGLFHPKKTSYFVGGCGIGRQIVIDVDGSVYECRRYPVKIGKMPEQRLEEIFSSELHIFHTKLENIRKCRDCPLFYSCRGCRAIAYFVNSDYFAEDPQCWRV